MKSPSTPLADFSEKNVQIFLILLSWVVYISVLIYLPTHLQNIELLGLAAIPVMTTSWVVGTRKGLVTALLATTLHIALIVVFEFNKTNWSTFFLQNLIGLIILALASTFAGYLRDLNEKKHYEISALQITEQKISRYGKLLKLINQSTSQFLTTPQWENRVEDFITHLGKAAHVDHVYLCEVTSQSSNSFLLYLRHHWFANKDDNLKPKLQKFSTAEAGIGFWVSQAEEGGSFSGQTSQLPQLESAFLSSIRPGSFLIFPIFTKRELWGFLGLENSQPTPDWEEFEADAIGSLAKTLGSTIHHQEIEETLNERARELQTLHTTSQQLSSTNQFETSLNTILKQVLTISPAHEAEIYLYANYKLTLVGHLQDQEQRTPHLSSSASNELAYSAARKKETILISNLRDHPLFQDIMGSGAISGAAIPLRIASQVIGVMNVWYPIERPFSEEETQILHLFGAQAATAIKNTQYFKAEHEQRKLAEALRQANLKLTTSLELTAVLESILEQTLKLVSAQDAHIFLYDGNALKLGAGKWADPEKNTIFATPRKNGLTYNVARSGERILVSDMKHHELFRDAPPDWEGAIVGLPLSFQEKVIGVMNVAFGVPRSFTDKDLRILDLLSDQAALAINNARTFEEEQNQRKFTEALQATGKIVISTLDLDTVFDHILSQLEKVVPYDTANLMLAEEGKLHVVRTQGYDQYNHFPDVKDLVLEIADFPTFCQMAENQQPMIITDTKTDPQWTETDTTAYVRSWAGAPIIEDEKLMGFLSLNKMETDFYQSKHGSRIAAFASQAAIAVKNARLFEAAQARVRELKDLHEATSSLVTTLEIEKLLEKIIHEAIQAIPGAEKGTLILEDPKTGKLQVRAAQGYTYQHITSLSLPLTNGYAAQTFQEKQPKLFNNIQESEDIAVTNDHITEISSVHSAICVPLLSKGTPLGVLSLDSTKKDAFTEADLELLASFAATATSAIINAQLHAKVQKLAITDSLTQTLNRRGLFQWGEYELERNKRFERPIAAIFFDLDHFKETNDNYGHGAGDQILSQVVSRCQAVIRQVDILGRYGGEEFVIILPESGQAEAFLIAERVRKSIAATPFTIDSQKIDMTLSLGVAEITPETKTLSDLIKAADRAMYQSKQNGRNLTSSSSSMK
ncbi:MAG: Response regulator PleD [Chloroflexi bacterium]|nr:Response regulator PleD [Chloroflexota bacterium]